MLRLYFYLIFYVFILLRMPYKFTNGLILKKDLMCASSATEASERKALWCDTSAITPERSRSSAQSADEASPSTGLSVDTGDLKVAMMQTCQLVLN